MFNSLSLLCPRKSCFYCLLTVASLLCYPLKDGRHGLGDCSLVWSEMVSGSKQTDTQLNSADDYKDGF